MSSANRVCGVHGGESQGDREAATLGLPLLGFQSLLPPPQSGSHLGSRDGTGIQGHPAKREDCRPQSHCPTGLWLGVGAGTCLQPETLLRPGWGLEPPRGFRQLNQAVVLAGSGAQATGETREPKPTHTNAPNRLPTQPLTLPPGPVGRSLNPKPRRNHPETRHRSRCTTRTRRPLGKHTGGNLWDQGRRKHS